MKEEYSHLYCDGGCRGNPGPAGVGVVLKLNPEKLEPLEYYEQIGNATNNIAEYRSLILGLEKSLENNIKNLHIFMDSQLVVYQIQGRYKVKNLGLRPLYAKSKLLLAKLNNYSIFHIRREENTHADRLANQALDSK